MSTYGKAIVGIIAIGMLVSLIGVAVADDIIGNKRPPKINDTTINESNKRYKVEFEDTDEERNYPLDIREQARYDRYGRLIAYDKDMLKEAILKDRDYMKENKTEEVWVSNVGN